MMASVNKGGGSGPLYCVCGKPYDPSKFMVQCDACKDWFHGLCVNLKELQVSDIDKYHCPKCDKIFGPSVLKKRTNTHRYNKWDNEAHLKPVQSGTPHFIRELKQRHFPSGDNVILRLRAQQLSLTYMQQNGFSQPVLVEQVEGLGLTVPPKSFTVNDVEAHIGGDTVIDVIDVHRQQNVLMPMREFVEYYTSPHHDKVFNVISLEFSNSSLGSLIEPPYIVRKLSWVDNHFPRQLPEDCPYQRPEVSLYCLMGIKDSYTDFHVDFGGTSVWYHVLKGEKIFYFVRPSTANLVLYERWMSSANQSETFFGDTADSCVRCIVREGQTLLIPTGWIHAVLTPVDSLVFGGNFLCSLNIPLQLHVYEMEKRMKTPPKFQFPSFEACNWYAATAVCSEIKDNNEREQIVPSHLIGGVKSLISALKLWAQEKDPNGDSRLLIPTHTQPAKLIKELTKELRTAERLIQRSRRNRMKNNNSVSDSTDEEWGRSTVWDTPSTLSPSSSLSAASKRPELGNEQPESSTKFSPVTTNARNPSSAYSSPDKDSPFSPSSNGSSSPAGDNSWRFGGGISLTSASPPATRRPVRKASQKKFQYEDSIYDFRSSESEDETSSSEEEDRSRRRRLVVDETRKQKNNTTAAGAHAIKIKIPLPSMSEWKPISSVPQSAAPNEPGMNYPPSVDSNTPKPHSGIEDLLLASGHLGDEFSSGRASPSTCEAIQGMLSISQAVPFPNQPVQGSSGTSVYSKRQSQSGFPGHSRPQRHHGPRYMYSSDEEFEESMRHCRQDEEYIYPSLEMSDDESSSPKIKRKPPPKDESWNPKARCTPNGPKPDRPIRDRVRKDSVESSIAATQAHLSQQSKHKLKKKLLQQQKAMRIAALAVGPGPSSPPFSPPSNHLVMKRPIPGTTPLQDDNRNSLGISSASRKPKKGFATPKQRLGKILKIHKMLH